ncbi:MAG: hypothetical protein FWC32_13145 [Firmicutes bacterium]|nr:hypothetical protein [Bacillota bacterium]
MRKLVSLMLVFALLLSAAVVAMANSENGQLDANAIQLRGQLLTLEGDWDSIDPVIVERVVNTFYEVWEDIVNFFGDGEVFEVVYVLGNNNVVLPNRVGITAANLNAGGGFNTDFLVQGLVQLAQGGPYPVPEAPGAFPAWITEGLRVFGRVHFGQYIQEGTWVPAAATLNPLATASGAQLLLFIAEEFGDAGVAAIRDMAQAARNGTYPLRRGAHSTTNNNGFLNTWVCDDLQAGFFYSRIGHSLDEAWTMFRAANVIVENEGFRTLAEALGGHTLVHGHALHRGPTVGVPANEGPGNLFNDNQNLKFVSTQAQNGQFWVEWRYDEPVYATRFVWQTANDNAGFPAQDFRRMNTGWTLSGSTTGEDGSWVVLYTGDVEDTGPFNFRFYATDLPGDTAFQFYRLHSPPPRMGNVIQLASVRIGSTTWQCQHPGTTARTTPATCGTEGYTVDVCTVCGEVLSEKFNITPIDPNARHTGSGNFQTGSFRQGPRPATTRMGHVFGEWDWVNLENNTNPNINESHMQRPGPGIAAMGFDPNLWWFERCTTCGEYVPVSDIYHTFLDPDPMPANRLPWSTVMSWTDIYERDGLGPGAMMDRFIHTFNTVWIPISLFMFDATLTENPAQRPYTINPVTFVLDANRGSIAWASGLQSGVGQVWLRLQPWDTDAMTHELVHNAQLYSGVPLHIHESMTDMMREYIGLFNHQADWRNPPLLLYEPGSPHHTNGFILGYRVGAAFWFWIDRYYIDIVRERTGVNYVHFAQAMNAQVKNDGMYFDDHRQYVRLTGKNPLELWAEFMRYEHARYAAFTEGWVPGYFTLDEAAGGRTLRTDVVFNPTHDIPFSLTGTALFSYTMPTNAGLGSWSNRQAENVFDRRIGPQGAASGANFDPNGGERGKFTASGWAQTTNGTAFQVVTTTDDFWVEWGYTEAIVACSLIIGTHDNLSLPRRMGDGWTLSGSNDGEMWTALYVGMADDYSNFNNRFFRFDIPMENRAPFIYYRLEAPPGPDGTAIQLAVIYLTGESVFSLEIFNNGEGGTQYPNPNESLEEAGLIRMWTRLGGENAQIHLAAADTIEAQDQDGECAMDFITVNRVWTDDEGFLYYFATIDVSKDGDWQYINFFITAYGQTLHVLLVNNWFEEDERPVPGFDIFNNGPGGSPSRPNPGLAAAGTIRMWTQLDGVNTPVYFAAADTIEAFDQDGNCAMYFVTVGRMWQDGTGWLDYFNRVDVDKNANWQYINFSITIFGRTVELLLVNANYPHDPPTEFDCEYCQDEGCEVCDPVLFDCEYCQDEGCEICTPVLPTFYLTASSVTVSNQNRHVSVFAGGTAESEITVNLVDYAPELWIQVRDNLWTPGGPVYGLVIGVASTAQITESRTVTLEVTRQGVTVLLSIELIAD